MTQDLSDLKLTKAQHNMLAFYDREGPTAQSDGTGTMNTWRALLRRGLLARSYGLGVITTEITPAGRAVLQPLGGSDEQAE